MNNPRIIHSEHHGNILNSVERHATFVVNKDVDFQEIMTSKGAKLTATIFDEVIKPVEAPFNSMLPIHPDEMAAVREEWMAAERSSHASAGSFSSGIPLVFTSENEMCPLHTVKLWMHNTPDVDLEWTDVHPYLRRMAKMFEWTIANMKNSGLWHNNLIQIERERTESPIFFCQFVLPWRIAASRYTVRNDTHTDDYTFTLSPINPFQGLQHQLKGIAEYDPFVGSPLTALFNYELQLDVGLGDLMFPEAKENEKHKGLCFLQLCTLEDGGGWLRANTTESDGPWPFFVWNKIGTDPATCIGRMYHQESKMHENNEIGFWDVKESDFMGVDGFCPSLKASVMKDIRYGTKYHLLNNSTDVSRYCIRPTLDSLLYDALTEYVYPEESEAADEEWGESSRFVQAWRDKRNTKTIDQTKGAKGYWSDVVRCKICNGRCKVILGEKPIKVIFDCPHCGESGCIDCTHLQPGEDWPEDKKRKVLKSK